jgi:hypothetical protein
MAARISVGVLLALGLAILVAWGPRALLVYAFFAAVSGGVALAAARGGEWLTGASARRFRDHDR